MLDILASFAQNEFKEILLMISSIIITGALYNIFCTYIGDPMQPRITTRKVRKLIQKYGRVETEKYLQSLGKRLQDYR